MEDRGVWLSLNLGAGGWEACRYCRADPWLLVPASKDRTGSIDDDG